MIVTVGKVQNAGVRKARTTGTASVSASTSTSLLRGTSNGNDAKRTNKDRYQNNKSTVAIIGGGVAGLSCAQHLQHSYDVTVYDTGRLRPGGRASSRQPNDRPKKDGGNGVEYPLLSRFRYDHAAQFITTVEPITPMEPITINWRNDFDQQVHEWIDNDILRVSPPNSMYAFERRTTESTINTDATSGWSAKCLNPSENSETQQQQQQFCYPRNGMSSLVDALVSGSTFNVEQDVWVSPSSGVKYQGPPASQGSTAKNGIAKDSWSVRAQGQTLGKHDHLIVAHNGKCADRLMSKTPAKGVHRLLRTNFNDRVPVNGGDKMTLNSIYSLTVCLKGPSLLSQNLPEAFVGGFVQNHPRLGLVTCQTNKYPTTTYRDGNDDESIEVWTILSTAPFAKKNKAPQEFLPEDVVQKVTQLLLDSLENDILCPGVEKDGGGKNGGTGGLLQNQVLESRLQLWGAGVPLNVWRGDPNRKSENDSTHGSAGFVHDPRYQVGVCGDWLLEASIAGAWTSGRRMAQRLIDTDHSSTEKCVGFKKGNFEASSSVRQLGLASLDGPMNNSNKNGEESKHPHESSTRSSSGGGGRGRGGRGRGRGGSNKNSRNGRGRRTNDRNQQGNQNRNRSETTPP